jgi:DNA-directed RNA polymerase specialized sigma24 family protein
MDAPCCTRRLLYLSLPILLRNVSLKAWLFQVARNRCLDELRKRRKWGQPSRTGVVFLTAGREISQRNMCEFSRKLLRWHKHLQDE